MVAQPCTCNDPVCASILWNLNGVQRQQSRQTAPGALKMGNSQVTRMISWEVAAGVCTCVMGQMSMAGGSWLLADVLVLSLTALSALPDSRQSAGSNSLASLGLLPAPSAVHLQQHIIPNQAGNGYSCDAQFKKRTADLLHTSRQNI